MLLPRSRGERFKDARKDAGFTMDDVKTGTGISKSMIQALEDDDSNRDVGYSNIAKLAAFYGVSADFLLGLSDVPSPEITLQAIGKETGLSGKAIRNIKSINNVSDEPISDYMLIDRKLLSSFLQHPKLRTCIENIHEAKRFSSKSIPAGTTNDDMANAEKAAYSVGGKMLQHFEAEQYYRHEAINALRDIVYDLVPDRKKEGRLWLP